jgi:integrase
MDDDRPLPIPRPAHRQSLLPSTLQSAGQAANRAAAQRRFDDYRTRRAPETVRRQDADLTLFAEFLYTAGVQAGELARSPETWQGISWGLVEAFIKWQLNEGYAVSTVNVRLSTIKTYARLAFQAGIVSPEDYALIRSVQGYSQRESRRIDAKRPQQRVGLKKASPVPISPAQAAALKAQPLDSPRGCRDAFLAALLLDHGLRVGETAGLKVEDLELQDGLLRFHRPKVGKTQVHRLSRDALRAARAYDAHLAGELSGSPLLRRVKKNGQLGGGLTPRAISLRVNQMGKQIGLEGLSAHDCRHYWATTAARSGTDPFSLQEAGGWSSLAMPRRYVEDRQIANEAVRLEKEGE